MTAIPSSSSFVFIFNLNKYNIKKSHYILAILLLFGLKQTLVSGQGVTFQGIVLDENREPVPFAMVSIDATKKQQTDYNGTFEFNAIEKGTHTIKISMMSFEDYTEVLTINTNLKKEFILKEASKVLSEVTINATTKNDVLNKEGFSVEIIEVKDYEKTKADVNEVLQEVPGIVVRQTGGLGSNFDVSLNGMSGKRVKFFIDNIPLETFGSSFSLNNFPVNLIKNIAVYKGVVPIELGSDALGGAINITTDQTLKNYLNTTYSYGSFNTHRLGLTAQKAFKNDFFIKFSGFFNQSDNNYWMDDIATTDEFGNINGTIRTRRFHDKYQSSMVHGAIGTGYKKWATRFEFGMVYSNNKNDVQHDLSLLRPYGKLNRSNNIFNTYLKYKKDSLLFDNLSFDLFSSYGQQSTEIVDTSSNLYDWFGNYIIRVDPNIGETSSPKTQFTFTDNLIVNQINLKYRLKNNQEIRLNYTQNYIRRQGDDPISNGVIPFKDPHSMNKNIWGLSHKKTYNKGKGESIIFGKAYLVNYQITQSDFSGNQTRVNSTRHNFGFGTAQSYVLSKPFLLKISYEKAYRIPDPYEIFGDGLNLKSNTDLLPENSHNFNTGLIFQKQYKSVNLLFNQNFFLRYAKDYIYIESLGPFARYTNKNNVNISGSESSIKIKYKKWASLSSSITYQNIIDGDKPFGDEASKNRIANIPYLFGSANLGFHKFNLLKENNKLSFFITGLFREEFYLISPGQGNPKYKNTIPRQTTLNTSVNYSWKKNKYGVTFSITNLLDQKQYDNFRIQKPGRAYTIKIKYSLNKS